jgi:uncharacterized protein (DUF885 family)
VRIALSAAAALFAAHVARSAPPGPSTSTAPAPAPATASSDALQKAGALYGDFILQESPALRLRLGLPVEKLPDLSLAKVERDAELGRKVLAALTALDVASASPALSHEDQLSADVLRREARQLVEGPKRYWLTFPVTPYTFQFLGLAQIFTSHTFRTKDDADRYERLLAAYPVFLRQAEDKLREQSKKGIVIAKPEIPLVTGAFSAQLAEKEANLFWVKPERLAALPEGVRADFSARIAKRIETETRPAVDRLVKYVSGEYAAKAPATVGLAQYPGGADYYRSLVRRTTTLDVAPEEIHRIGLDGIAKINAELDEIRKKVKFQGSLADFRKSLKSDPRFYAKTPEEVGERLMAAQNRILAKIPEYFGRAPKAPFGVKRLDQQLEGSMTFGYYQVPTPTDEKGYYKYNGSHLEDRSLIGAGSLISHELVPGHHFQINLQHENGSLPPYRKDALTYTAFVEGWGEYSSYLAGEMGMYADPYDRAGRLLFDAFLTSRLVLDTGMNLLGWSREKAMDYMRQNTIQSETEIATETLRYCCDLPSQALAYKMGMRKFVELREKARRALGPKFDMRRYHDMLLASGAVPMDLAEKKVDWFIAEEKAR